MGGSGRGDGMTAATRVVGGGRHVGGLRRVGGVSGRVGVDGRRVWVGVSCRSTRGASSRPAEGGGRLLVPGGGGSLQGCLAHYGRPTITPSPPLGSTPHRP